MFFVRLDNLEQIIFNDSYLTALEGGFEIYFFLFKILKTCNTWDFFAKILAASGIYSKKFANDIAKLLMEMNKFWATLQRNPVFELNF